MMSVHAIVIDITIAFIMAWQQLQLHGEYSHVEHYYQRT